MDRKGAELLGNEPQPCWDEGCDAGYQMFMIIPVPSELPALTEGSPAWPGPVVWLQLAILSGFWKHGGPGSIHLTDSSPMAYGTLWCSVSQASLALNILEIIM